MKELKRCDGEHIFDACEKEKEWEKTIMKKVLALALALIMTLALGVTAFAQPSDDGTTIVWDGWSERFESDFREFPIDDWDIDNENIVILPYDYGDFAMIIDGSETFDSLFRPEVFEGEADDDEDTLSSIKVESEKGLIDVTVYKLDDYVKNLDEFMPSGDIVTEQGISDFGIETKSNWPFEDFDVEDLLESYEWHDDPYYWDEDENPHLDLYFVYFDFPTYAGVKVSGDNYFTLKFRENTTGDDHVETSKKVWFCIYPWAVLEEDVETYADEDEAMELVEGEAAFDEDSFGDLMEDLYKNVPGNDYIWIVQSTDEMDEDEELSPELFKKSDEWNPPHVFAIGRSLVPYVITKDAWKEIIGSTLIVGVADDLEVEIGKIVKGQTGICFYVDTDVDDDIQALNEDAELSALLFLNTTDVLDSDFVVSYTFPIEDAAKAGDYFLYELVGDELKLVQKVAVGKGDDEVDVDIARKAGETLGQYYLSDVELAATAAPSEEEENPNTGASEVAGVAVALAVLSLCSAAAVALKK